MADDYAEVTGNFAPATHRGMGQTSRFAPAPFRAYLDFRCQIV